MIVKDLYPSHTVLHLTISAEVRVGLVRLGRDRRQLLGLRPRRRQAVAHCPGRKTAVLGWLSALRAHPKATILISYGKRDERLTAPGRPEPIHSIVRDCFSRSESGRGRTNEDCGRACGGG